MQLVLIRWLVIYSVDSAVQLLNNPGQLISFYEEDVTVSEMPTRAVRKVLMFPLNARVCAHITNCYVTWDFKHLSPVRNGIPYEIFKRSFLFRVRFHPVDRRREMLKEILILLLFVLSAGKSRELGDSLSDVQEGSHNNVLEEGTFLNSQFETVFQWIFKGIHNYRYRS